MTATETVSDIGERELIRRLAPWVQFGRSNNGVFGIGDDCAILTACKARQTVITTDMLIAGTHFVSNCNTNWAAVGHKAAVANISDIAAMGAQPAYLLVSIALPAHFLLNDVLALYGAMYKMSSHYGAAIIGGDTTRSEQICISVTALGLKTHNSADCLRSDAQPGDYLYVTGDLGRSRAGLEIILNASEASEPPKQIAFDLNLNQNAKAHTTPQSISFLDQFTKNHFFRTPRVEAGLALSTRLKRAAIIDISDSLYSEALLMAEASGVRISLNLDSLPISHEVKMYCLSRNVDAHQFALFSGEEYELLFAVPENPDELHEKMAGLRIGCTFTLIGRTNSGNGVEVLTSGNPVTLNDQTFDHFL